MDLGYRPLVYMWVAEYRDGSALPQFDPETGEENRFAEIDQSRLCKFGWYPFSVEMVAKMSVKAIPTINPYYTIDLKPDDELFAVRRNHITHFTYRLCLKCEARWQFGKGDIREMVKLPVSDKAVVTQTLLKTSKGEIIGNTSAPICPKCGYYDPHELAMKDRQIKRLGAEVRETIYLLGIEGKKIIKIKENGSLKEEAK